MKTETYETDGFYDEMFESDGRPRPGAEVVARRLASLSEGELERRQKAADLALLNMGITFNVYGHEAGTEKVWPFDIVPRILDGPRVGPHRTGTQAAHPSAQPVHRRRLQRAEDHQRRRRARVADLLGQMPAGAVQRSEAAARHLVPHHGHRPGARQRRRVLRAGRQSALPVGRVVRAGKPRSDEADVSAGLRRAVRSCRSRIIRSSCCRCCNTSRRRRSRSRTWWC